MAYKKKLYALNPKNAPPPLPTQRAGKRTRLAPADARSIEREVRQLLADKVSGNLLGLWLLVPEHLRLGTWDLLRAWSGDATSTALAPRIPVASGGYLLALPDGRLLLGATSQADDEDPTVREADHRDNLAKAAQLLGGAPLHDGAALHGRVGWRASTPDRLPLVGPAPDPAAPRPARADAPRLWSRQPGLWLHCGLGSRGLTTATLCAELIAAQASGAPWPLEADLVDAIDPARWLVRGG